MPDLAAIRGRYFPSDGVRFLLLGESPPPGRGFFYRCDSTLYRAAAPVFRNELGYSADCSEFLKRFAADGFFLDDFSQVRGDKPHQHLHSAGTRSGILRISRFIAENKPRAILGVLIEIGPLIADAVQQSSEPLTPWHCIRFPHHRSAQSQVQFQFGLRDFLRRWVS